MKREDYYTLDERPEYTGQFPKIYNADWVIAESGPLLDWLMAVMNAVQAVHLDAAEAGGLAGAAIPLTQKGIPNGVATLASDGRLVQKPTAEEVGARPASWMPTAAETGAVPVGRTVNGKSLSADIAINKADLGLSNVANTADGDKNVRYAASAGSAPANGGTSAACSGNSATANVAARLGINGNTGSPATFNWSGQGGQPSWLWGGNDTANMYLYNPSAFNVNYANSAGNAATASGLSFAIAASAPTAVTNNRVTFVYG